MQHVLTLLRQKWRSLLALPALLLLAVLVIGLHAYARFTTMIAPLRDRACCALPVDTGLAITPVAVTTADHLTLACWYLPSQNRATIILLHGEGGSRQTMLTHLRMLAMIRTTEASVLRESGVGCRARRHMNRGTIPLDALNPDRASRDEARARSGCIADGGTANDR